MSEKETNTEKNFAESIQEGLLENFGGQSSETVKQSKRNSLKEMKKSLPDWSLEPPETYLA